MKKLQNKSNLVIAALMSIFVIALTPAMAAETKVAPVPSEEVNTPQVNVKCVGYQNDSPIFQLSFANEEADEFFITIKDQQYNTIYSEKIKGANLTRKFQLVNEDKQEGDISFEITSKKTNKTVKYKVSTVSKTVSDTEIIKVD